MSGNILVTCATGSLGQLTIDALLAQKVPAKSIFAECRDPKKPGADALGKKGITVRKGDFTDTNAMVKTMAGIQTLMFISSGSLDKRYEQHANVLSAAKSAGIKHIVYTSILKCSKDSKYLLTPDHVKTEEALLKSGIPYTIFRNTYYMDLLPYMLGDALSSGKWSYPAGNAKVNFVAKCDIAEGLAKVLTNLGPHLNKTYEIASSKSYTFAEIAPILAKATGKPIEYNAISLDQFKAALKGFGMSEFDVKHFASSADAVAAGQIDTNDTALDKILGHKTKTMEEYLPVLFKK